MRGSYNSATYHGVRRGIMGGTLVGVITVRTQEETKTFDDGLPSECIESINECLNCEKPVEYCNHCSSKTYEERKAYEQKRREGGETRGRKKKSKPQPETGKSSNA